MTPDRASTPRARRLLVVIPAYNEALCLPRVLEDIRVQVPEADVLVVDDASEDDTPTVLGASTVAWLRLPFRAGTGSAVRVGLRYALQEGYEYVVRLDGDGQHPAELIHPMIQPLEDGADVVVGSRYVSAGVAGAAGTDTPFGRRLVHRSLAWVMTTVALQPITDPTSGLWAFGPRALAMLAEHHPSGYPEPELLMFLSRNGMRVREVPVTMRERIAGRTSLTPHRTSAALARLLLLLLVVPWRDTVEDPRR